MAKQGLVVRFVSGSFRLGWNLPVTPMTSRITRPPTPLRAAAATAGLTATALAYWYWDSAVIDIDDIIVAAAMAVIKVFAISVTIVAVSGVVSLFWPAHRTGPDRLWLVRRLGGPGMALGTLVGVAGAVVLAGYLMSPEDGPHPLVGMLLLFAILPLLGAIISAGKLGLAHQFRLGEAHRDLPAVCIACTGLWGLVDAIANTAGGGINHNLPIVVWILVTFVGPVVTMTLAVTDIYAARRIATG